ncbi:hypothetical protein GIW81_00775 [Hyphomicrobium sp. xq]|uniref:Uncharacterized protein n=1 Tax=Hyphomicrobium album TaxID=2665159 RepID=A0A6I3KJ97_9HYPH|nr:hypothetical protein [Hyphomicrobium album]MTD92861.1 hypothetical protein [Hyphomicrobium album]
MRVTSLLEERRRLLEALASLGRGWCQGQFATFRVVKGGQVVEAERCLVGALQAARVPERTYQRFTNLLFGHKAVPRLTLADWNDEPERTLTQVLRLTRRVVKRVEADIKSHTESRHANS